MKTYKSFTVDNIHKYQHRQRVETAKVIGVMVAEAITAILLTILAILYFGIAV